MNLTPFGKGVFVLPIIVFTYEEIPKMEFICPKINKKVRIFPLI